MGVAGDEVGQATGGEVAQCRAGIRLEDERGGHLDQRAARDQRLEPCMEVRPEVALRMRDDRAGAAVAEPVDGGQERVAQRAGGGLDQDPAAVPAQRDPRQLRFVEPVQGGLGHLAAGRDGHRHAVLGESDVEPCDAVAQLADPDVVVVADVRGGAHDLDPVVRSLAPHRDGVGLVERPVVHAREDVAVQVDESHMPTVRARSPGVAPLVLDNPDRVALLGAELVANRLRARPGLRIALPTGRTPIGMYAALRAHAAAGRLPASQAVAFQLDEYAGLGPGDPQSFAATLRREAGPLGFGTLHELDGAAPDLTAECERHQRLLDQAPLDLAVLGLGRDGHVAFDEPGTPADARMRRVRLTEQTRQDAADAFGSEDHVPGDAITIGLRTLLQARALVLLVTGEAKAAALRTALEGPVTPAVPASLLRGHPRLTVVCDRAAAAQLRPDPGWSSDRALVVLGHRRPGISTEHVISDESLARVRRAAALAGRDPVRAAVFTGWTTTGGLSEAEQMLTWWNEPGTPGVLEVAGRRTAENASCSLPLLLAMGVIRRVTVVTSAWHVRSRWFFAPYRRYGLEVDYAPVFHRGPWGALLRNEIRQAPAAPRERRDAFADVALPPDPARVS